MNITFPNTGFDWPGEQGEIDSILQRIAIGTAPGQWPDPPDAIEVLRRLSGGRSGCEVLEVDVVRKHHKTRKVIKLGPLHELENEFNAFQAYLTNANALFVRIEATTPGLLPERQAIAGEREAVVYDQAARSQSTAFSRLRTFEEVARTAIQEGGPVLEKAIQLIETFFEGVRNDLYDHYDGRDSAADLREAWNRRLGFDAVVAIDSCVAEGPQSKNDRFDPPRPQARNQAGA